MTGLALLLLWATVASAQRLVVSVPPVPASNVLTLLPTGNLPADAIEGFPSRCAQFDGAGALGWATTDCGVGGGIATAYVYLPAGLPTPMYDFASEYVAPNTVRCATVPLAVGVTNATHLAFRIIATGSPKCGMMIYSADGTTPIATTGGLTCTGAAGANMTATVPAFTLTAGATYRYCWTTDTASNPQWASVSMTHTWANQLATPQFGVAANGSTAGAPPSTTGALTPWANEPTTSTNLPYLLVW